MFLLLLLFVVDDFLVVAVSGQANLPARILVNYGHGSLSVKGMF